jgi:acyl dehydratase
MRFAEYHVGQVIEAGPYAVTAEEIIRFARAYDPQWFHVDAEAARQSRFGGLIASGWHTCAIAMRMVVEAALDDSESLASPGIDELRWPHPVRPGDVLRVRITVHEVRTSRSQPNLGIVRWKVQMRNASDTEVLSFDATSLFDLAAPARGAGNRGAPPI